MLNKKIMVIVILLVSLLAISGVSAVDNVTRDIVSNDVASEEVVSVENDKQVIESVDVEIDYLNTNSEGTFTDLANEITNAKGELNLTKNYRYHSNIDSNYQNGIVITKKITINGNGVIIDGGKQTRAIVISYGGVVLNNISFVNCNNRGGAGAIHWYGNDGMLFDCSFVNCSSSSINTYKDGGAVDWSGSNGMLFDCSFVNCSSTKSGGSVFWSGNEGMLFDCDFINSSSYDQGGGALYLDCSNFKITNCTFINNYVASNTGGALGSLSTSINVTILNCSFINNTADWGGALDLCGYNITLNHCLFDNNVAKTYSGGAIRWYQIKGGKIIDCYFHNNVAVKYGSDILYQSQNGDIINYYSDNLNGIFFESGSSNVNITRCSLSFGCENFSLYYADDKSYSAHLTTSTGFSVANKSIKFEIYRKGVSKVIDTISDENGIAKISDISSILDVGIWNIRVINENNQYVYYNSNALIQVNKSNSSVKIYDINTSWDSETTFTAHVNSNNKTINEGTVSFYIGDEFMGDASVINGTAVLTNEAPGYAGEHKITAIFNSNNYLSSNSTAKMFVDTGDIEVEDYDSIATFKALIELIENTPKSGVLNLTKNYIYVLGSNSGVQINKPITIDGQGHTLDGNQLSRILYVSSNEVHLKNINFVNGFTNGGGSCIYFYGSNGTIDSCNFTNSSSRDKIGAVEIAHDENKVMNCIFTNNTAKHMAGIGWNNDNCGLINCIFINNYASTYGGAMGCFGENGYVENCQFIHNKNSWGASVYWGQNAYYGIVINCSFIYNSGHSSYDNQYAVAWYSDYGNLINCSFKEELAINWAGNNGKLINCSFIDKSTNNIKIKQSQTIDIIKRNIGLTSSNHIFEYNNPEIMSVDFKNILDNLPIRSDVIFLFNDGANNKFFTKRPYNNSIDLFDELSTLNVGNWTVNVIFNGDDNYYPTNITNTITILPSSSSLVIGDVNTTVSHEITLVANVNSTLAINEGIVTFFDGETNIGETGVYGGVATLTYTPFDAGEHTITAIFNSNNYLSSNSTAKLLVDNATVEILVNTGTVGYNSTFVANVNGLYSIINEGNVAFYINKEYIGTVPVVDGYASLVYTPLTAGDYTVRAVFRNSAKFLDDESSTVYTVKPVDSTVTIDDLNGTVGHELTLIANIVSSNNLTINEGVVTFFDCETNIGEANVYDSIATLTYIPTNAGEHKITAIFNSNNYLSSNSTAKMFVDTGDIEVEDYDSIATFKALIELIENTPKSGVLNLTKNYIYVLGSNSGVQINKPITIDGQGHTLDGNQLSRILYVSSNEVHLKNINFVNGFTNGGGSCIYFYGSNGTIDSCNFTNSSSRDKIGAVEIAHDENKVMNCIFTNNTAKHMAGIGWNNDNCGLINCIFINNYASTYGGAMGCFGENGYVENCQFIHNKNSWGASVYWGQNAYYGIVINCSFIYNSGHSSYDNQYAVAWYSDYGNLINCSFKEELAINWAGNNGKLINCSFIDKSTNNIKIKQSQTIDIIKRNIGLTSSNHIFEYNNPEIMSVDFKNILDNLPIRSDVIFLFNDGANNKFFTKRPYNNSIDLFDELSTLNVGNWTVNVIFNGDDNYYPTNITNTITILPSSSSLVIGDVNTTVSHEITLVANVNSTLAINEGIVTFFDGETNIGETGVYGGVATLTYTPFDAGEHTITAIFNSNNYLSSNSTAKLLVDNATVEILVNTGTVGYNSTFVANVKGLYSIINEGTITFYINDEYLDTVPVVDGYASLAYIPLATGDYTVKAVFSGSKMFLIDENSTIFTVKNADSELFISDLNGTIGHELIILVAVLSHNNLTINEGCVVFFDGETNIGKANVYDTVATLVYTPSTVGEHKITAIFNSDNYGSSNDTALLTVSKDDVELNIDYITDVYFTNPSNFAVNVNSNFKPVTEGKVKYYVNNELVGTVDVYEGNANFNYVTGTAGSFTLTAAYEETDNYFAKNASATFNVNKMPTTLSGESIIFDEEAYKTFTTELKDNNNNGVGGQPVKIEVIKYSGESRTLTGISDANGITIYDVDNLAGGMWYVTGTYDGNDNYVESTFADKFIIVRMDTTTAIEEITNPLVNHTYKFKANIYDENEKLVKEGIIQFYLDGVDIGFIDLSNSNGYQNDLSKGVLGAINPIFAYELGADEEASDLYIEYIPTKAGKHTLTAVYEGTTIYKSSNQTTTFIVSEESNVEPEIIIPPLDEPSTDGSVTISLPSDAIGTVTLTIGGKDYVFDVVNGVANVKLPELGDGNYNYTITYSGDNKYSSFSTNGNMKINNTKPEDTKPTPEIIIPPLDEPSSDGSVTIILPNDATGKVTLSINGKSYNYLVENGVANVIIPNLGEGDYPYTITYSGDSKYSSFTTNGSLNKSAPKVDPKITAKNTAVQYSAKGKYSVTVYGTDGKVATGVEVVFKISGKQVGKAKTNTKGVASYVVTKNPGKYKIQATALGKSVTKTVTVKHIVTLKTVTLKKSAKKLTLQATLAKVNGKYLKKKTITFKINGKKVATAKTNSKGVAKITIKNPSVVKKLKVGKKVTYQATYLKDTVKKTAKIKK